MKTVSIPATNTTTKNEVQPVSTRAPIKVCMHLLDTARTDFRVMRDALALKEAGFEVHIVDIDRDPQRPAEEVISGVHFKHIHVPGWYTPTRFKPWFLAKMALAIIISTCALLKTDAAVYHAHVEKALPAAYIAARLRRKPIIFDAPELTLTDPTYARWRRLHAVVTWVLARVVPACEGVITASPLYARELQKQYRAREVTLIRNVPAYQTIAHSNRLREYLSLGPGTRIALYQGNLQPNRGLDALVHAARFLNPHIVFVMMGNDYRNTRTQLETLIADEKVAEQVKIIPAAPYEELLSWTASADIGLTILPQDYSLSIKLCLPNKLFEYLMAGLPVLSTPLEAVADILATYDVGQVISSSKPEDIGATINTMLDDEAALADMRRNALAAAEKEFHWEKEREKLIKLYRKLSAQ